MNVCGYAHMFHMLCLFFHALASVFMFLHWHACVLCTCVFLNGRQTKIVVFRCDRHQLLCIARRDV